MLEILTNADIFQKATIAVLLVMLVWAVYRFHHRQVESALKILGLACLASIFLLAVSLNYAELEREENPVQFVLKCILFALHSIKFEIKDYDLPHNDPNDGTVAFFSTLLTLLIILIPFFLLGFMASFVEPLKKYLRFHFLKKGKRLYFFSELNEKAIYLAKDIVQKDNKAWIVFCKCSFPELNKYLTEKDSPAFFAFSRSILESAKDRPNESFYFELYDNSAAAIDEAFSLIQKLSGFSGGEKRRIRIFVFSNAEKAKFIFNAETKHNLNVSIVNELEITALNLLLKCPLYRAPRKAWKQTVLIAGMGNTGVELFKSLIWANCNSLDKTLKIIVADKNASFKRNELKRDYPEIFNGEYDLLFMDVDTRTDGFTKLLADCDSHVNYVVVATENDEENLKTANFLQCWFLRKYGDASLCPKLSILAKERHSSENDALIYGNPSKGEYCVMPFGSLDEIYSYELIVNSEIEKLAMNVHAAYSNFDESAPCEPAESVATYMEDENNKCSSRVAAVHIFYKLYALGFTARIKDAGETQDARVLDEFQKKLKDSNALERLTRLEHDRWNAYMRSSGWVRLPLEKTTGGKRKNNLTKEHACLCSWDDLQKVNDFFREDFCSYDRKMILLIPEILGIAGNRNINVSCVEYLLGKI